MTTDEILLQRIDHFVHYAEPVPEGSARARSLAAGRMLLRGAAVARRASDDDQLDRIAAEVNCWPLQQEWANYLRAVADLAEQRLINAP